MSTKAYTKADFQDYRSVRARMKSNTASAWPSREMENRLEPECWPHWSPKFRISRDHRIFTIGSCFARNIEKYLHEMGFELPIYRPELGFDSLIAQLELNKYTPPGIAQELEWTWTILNRDDVVRDTDIAPLLFELGDGRVIDMHLANFHISSMEEALRKRMAVYQVMREAFFADVVIMTLGLIECWWDEQSSRFIQQCPSQAMMRGNERFHFRRLGFKECFEFVSGTIDRLLEGAPDRKILLTTSPVPLMTTFTGDDVVVANAHGKSVLRAVAGELQASCPQLDYFPSYESVMLTRQSYVWTDDLRHVSADFVGRVVLRMVKACFDDPGLASGSKDDLDRVLLFCNLVDENEYGEAERLYPTEIESALVVEHASFHLHAAAFCVEFLNDPERATRHLQRALSFDNVVPAFFYAVGLLYHEMGMPEPGDRAIGMAMGKACDEPMRLLALIEYLRAKGENARAVAVGKHAIDVAPSEPRLLFSLAAVLVQAGQDQEAIDLYARMLPYHQDSFEVHLSYARLLTRHEQFERAQGVLKAFPGAEDFPETLPMLVHIAHQLGDYSTECSLLCRMIECSPDEARWHHRLAWVHFRFLKNPAAAQDRAQAAVRLEPGHGDHHNLLVKILIARGASEAARDAAAYWLQCRPQSRAAKAHLQRLGAKPESGADAGAVPDPVRLDPVDVVK